MARNAENTSRQHGGPLISEFAGDSDMAELVDYFVHELQERINSLQQAWSEGETDQLRRLAHQIKGAAGGYGFPSITAAAAELEQTLLAAEAESSTVAERLEELVSLCRRAVAGHQSN